MDYDVVIATRNRPEALKLSIPLILGQSRKPKRLIVVDASDEHQLIRKTVKETVGNNPVELVILNCLPNLSRQRNMGLKYVEAPVVMFPDDDSLWWPGLAEAIMRIYERDTNGDIGGVCAKEIKHPPPQICLNKDYNHQMRFSNRIRQKIERPRHWFDYRACPDPNWVLGKSLWNDCLVPEWLSEENAKLVEYMGGFRMSFRTVAIREYGFNEDLGKYVGWAACEDADACFHVMRKRLVVGAHDARVFHYKAPDRRGSGFEVGFITSFNRAYVISMHSEKGSIARRAVKRFGIYKLMLYMLGMHSKFGRDRVRGSFTALKLMGELLSCSASRLRQRYLAICKETLALQSKS